MLAVTQAAFAADLLGFHSVGIQDFDNNGVVDENDAFTSTARRRTIELGPRTGTDLKNLPKPETARTTTLGFAWEPGFLDEYPTTISLGYYDLLETKPVRRHSIQVILSPACLIRLARCTQST